MKSKVTFGSGKQVMNTSLPVLFAVVSLSLLSGSLYAQTDFSGTWAFNESKSSLGEGPMMSATSMTISQQGNVLTVDLVQPSFEGGEMKRSEKYTLDGKESVNEGMMGASVKTITSWSEDKKELRFAKTIAFDMDGQAMEMKLNDAWTLSGDGKALTVKSSMKSDWGEMNTSLVYDKK